MPAEPVDAVHRPDRQVGPVERRRTPPPSSWRCRRGTAELTAVAVAVVAPVVDPDQPELAAPHRAPLVPAAPVIERTRARGCGRSSAVGPSRWRGPGRQVHAGRGAARGVAHLRPGGRLSSLCTAETAPSVPAALLADDPPAAVLARPDPQPGAAAVAEGRPARRPSSHRREPAPDLPVPGTGSPLQRDPRRTRAAPRSRRRSVRRAVDRDRRGPLGGSTTSPRGRARGEARRCRRRRHAPRCRERCGRTRPAAALGRALAVGGRGRQGAPRRRRRGRSNRTGAAATGAPVSSRVSTGGDGPRRCRRSPSAGADSTSVVVAAPRRPQAPARRPRTRLAGRAARRDQSREAAAASGKRCPQRRAAGRRAAGRAGRWWAMRGLAFGESVRGRCAPIMHPGPPPVRRPADRR